MNSIRNKVQLIGKLGTEPEIRSTEGGKKMAKFTLATNESYKDANGTKVEDTTWHNVVVWGPKAGVIEKYVKKGQELCIEGRINHRVYEDKEGVKRYFTEIVANDFLMLGGKKAS